MTKQTNFKIYFLSLLICLLSVSGCRKIIPEVETDILFIGHKGAGSNNFNDVNMENTLNAVKEGFANLDGVELDLQMSKDGTIWVNHNFNVHDFNCLEGLPEQNIPLLTDAEIEEITICHDGKTDRLYKLAEIIDYWNLNPQYYLFMEVKVFYDPAFDLIGGLDAYFRRMATVMINTLAVADKTDNLIIEINSKSFIDLIKANEKTKNIKCLLIRSGTLERKIQIALQEGYDGLSLNYTDVNLNRASVKAAQNLGLFINLYTPYYKSEIVQAFEMQPNAVQTDNMDAKRYLNVR
ncbi:glycerophosphodiester phosphodiesterase [Pedobacter glucosidilyticus]|uniref:glycerophosphodiester phosphodiesterase n=1 Tax=Pedobacter glucosidilyticus TaxID=1122941 RepID=UPI0026EF187D|nr:glycerophosphodiester phosphodiesterase family protein [Pedobacter glucosidilyticus]